MNQLQSNDIVDKINEIIANLRKIYSDKTINYFNQLNQSNDARVMAFNKIHNCILCYDITWKTFVKTFSDDFEYNKLLAEFNLYNQSDNFKEGFPYSYNMYISFGVYIRLFCSLESSLRVIYHKLATQGYFNSQNKFVSIDTVMAQIIKYTKINNEYKNLVSLLSNVRNLMHGFGAFPYNDKSITYKGKEYKFTKPFVSADLVKLEFLLPLFEKDVINMLDDIFQSSVIKSISFIKDDLDTNLDNYKKYLNTQN